MHTQVDTLKRCNIAFSKWRKCIKSPFREKNSANEWEHVHCQFRLPEGRWCSLAELLACISRGYTLIQAFDVVWDMTEYGSILNPFRYVWFDIDRYIFEGMSLSRYGRLNLCSPQVTRVVVATLAHLRDFCLAIWSGNCHPIFACQIVCSSLNHLQL